jgi:hypothetical protein
LVKIALEFWIDWRRWKDEWMMIPDTINFIPEKSYANPTSR